jgi:phosphoribosylanthranilate isomerase
MEFRIKICGVTNRDDARAAADAGADAIGLNFFSKSRRFIDPLTARKVADEIPNRIMKVGVFVNHDAAEIVETVELVGLDAVQLQGDEPAKLLAELPVHLPIVRAHRCGREGLASLSRYLEECRSAGRLPDAVLIDADAGTDFGGSGKISDWATIARDRESLSGLPLILAGGLTPNNVAAAINAVSPDGVDVATGVEREPGSKDAELVTRFIAAARDAFARI